MWSGYPEMVPFYEHVAEGMKEKHPDLDVSVEAIPLREHEKRMALGLTSGEAADVIELGSSTARALPRERPAQAGARRTSPTSSATPRISTSSSQRGQLRRQGLRRAAVPRPERALLQHRDVRGGRPDRPPKTMEEYTDYAEKLTQRDASGNPTVSGWSLRLSGGGQGIAEKFWINMFQYGGSLLEQTADGKWRASFANEAGRAALKQYLENVHV